MGGLITISELSRRIRQKEISPVEVTQECLRRIDAFNPRLNAFITVTGESALAEAKKALEGSDASVMNSARERLTQASHKLAEAMYKSAPAQPAAAQPGDDSGAGEKKKDEGVIDAEYVDVDEKK